MSDSLWVKSDSNFNVLSSTQSLIPINQFYNYSITCYRDAGFQNRIDDLYNQQILSVPNNFFSQNNQVNIFAQIIVAGISSDVVGYNSKLFYLITSYVGQPTAPNKSSIYCLKKDNNYTYYSAQLVISNSDFINQTDGKLYFSLGSNVKLNKFVPVFIGTFNTNYIPIPTLSSASSSLLAASPIQGMFFKAQSYNKNYTKDIFGQKINLDDINKGLILFNSDYEINKMSDIIYYDQGNILITEDDRSLICPSYTLVKCNGVFLPAIKSHYFKEFVPEKSSLIKALPYCAYFMNEFEIINPISKDYFTNNENDSQITYIYDCLQVNEITYASKSIGHYSHLQINLKSEPYKRHIININRMISRCLFIIISSDNIFVSCKHEYKNVNGKQIFIFDTTENKTIFFNSNQEFHILDFVGCNV